MRAIYLVHLDKMRPAIILTNPDEAFLRAKITVAPVTSSIRHRSSEVPVGVLNNLDHDSVINCDDITTVPSHRVDRFIGVLGDDQESELALAITHAFDLRIEDAA